MHLLIVFAALAVTFATPFLSAPGAWERDHLDIADMQQDDADAPEPPADGADEDASA